ncbi:hypothetical protein BST61_g11004 [Cercospora zeina]
MKRKLAVVITAALAVAEGRNWNATSVANSTAGVSAECSASTSTVFIPYTETVTATALSSPNSIEGAVIVSGSSSSTSYTTVSAITTIVSRTTVVTVQETSPAPPGLPSDATTVTATVPVFSTVQAAQVSTSASSLSSPAPPYTFRVTGGSTVWQNGAAPSSGASLNIATSFVTVSPVPLASASPPQLSAAAEESRTKPLTTFTPPAYSSTTFSVLSSALTTTLTSTRYITRSLSRVSPPASSRTGFPGMTSAGWNTTSEAAASATEVFSTPPPRFTKFTRVVYFGHDDITTSTSTQLVTATIGEVILQTVSPVLSGSVSTMSGAGQPITMTYTLGTTGFSYSTSIAFPSGPDRTGSAGSQASVAGTTVTNVTTTATSILYSVQTSSSSGTVLPSSGIHQTIGAASETASTRLIPTTRLASATFSSSANSTRAVVGVDSSQPASTSAAADTSIASITKANSTSTVNLASSLLDTSSHVLPNPNPGATTNALSTTATGLATSARASGPPGSASAASSLGTSSSSGTATLISSNTIPASGYISSRVSVSTALISAADATASTRTTTVLSPTVQSDAATATTGSSTGTSSVPRSTGASNTAVQTPSSVSTSTSFATSTYLSTSSLRSLNSSASASLTSSAISPASTCGEQGNFTMNFDDLPTFRPGSARLIRRQITSWNGTRSPNGGNGTSDITQQPPLSLRPYRHMLFSGGYVYAPPPVEPFAPASPPNVAVFLANGTGLKAGPAPPMQDGLEPGEIADGPYHEGNPAFFFDAHSAALGCDSQTAPCAMEITGYTWNNTVKDDVPTYSKNFTLPACESYRNCQLTKVEFPETFRNLSGIRMRAVRGSEPRTFFVDDIKARWADSSCGAGKTRQNSP